MDAAAMFGSSTARFLSVSEFEYVQRQAIVALALGSDRVEPWANFNSALFLCYVFKYCVTSIHLCLQSKKTRFCLGLPP